MREQAILSNLENSGKILGKEVCERAFAYHTNHNQSSEVNSSNKIKENPQHLEPGIVLNCLQKEHSVE